MASSNIIKEYNCIINGVGYFDFSFEGKIKVYGDNSIDFINGLVSNDIRLAKENSGIYTAFLDKFGRVLSDCYIFRFKDFFLINLPFITKNKIFEKLSYEGKFAKSMVIDDTLNYAIISLQGKYVDMFLRDLLGERIYLKELEFSNKKIDTIEVIVISRSRGSQKGYDLIFDNRFYKEILEIILKTGKKYNLMKIGNESYDILRLEAGIPLYGIDFDDKTILSDIGESAISYTKGCFVGQKVIARIKNIGKGFTAKKLVSFTSEAKKKIDYGTEIFTRSQKIGFVTSSAFSPLKNKVFGLGHINRPFYQEFGEIEIGDDKVKGEILRIL